MQRGSKPKALSLSWFCTQPRRFSAFIGDTLQNRAWDRGMVVALPPVTIWG